MARNFPAEQHVFDLRPSPDVMHDHVSPAGRRSLIRHDANVRHAAAKIPRHDVTWGIVFGALRDSNRFSLAAEKDHEIRHAPVINVGVRMSGQPFPLARIR